MVAHVFNINMQPKLTHVALLVNNVDKTADFYIKYTGLKVIERRIDPKTGFRVIWLGHDMNFVVVAFEGETNTGFEGTVSLKPV